MKVIWEAAENSFLLLVGMIPDRLHVGTGNGSLRYDPMQLHVEKSILSFGKEINDY